MTSGGGGGTAADRGLRVAVVGSGPAGLYTADALTFDVANRVDVDLIERLPEPFGLLRYGVAPDHLTIKKVSESLQEVLDRPSVNLLCNVEVGRTVQVDELRECYDAVVYATGADADRRIGVGGEDLPGSASATSFVKWYNGHPDALDFDLSTTRRVVVVGAGNVALDVTRMLVKDPESLRDTGIPRPVLQALATSGVTDVHIVARRGPEHARFTTKELRELGALTDVDIVVDGRQIPAQPPDGSASLIKRNLVVLSDFAERTGTGASRRIHFHFHARPEGIRGGDVVRAVRISQAGTAGWGTEVRDIPAELVLRAVGYRSQPVAGVPFAEDTATIPHVDHRVLREGRTRPGEYAVGWAKRGPTGILGTNRADAEDTARALLDDRAHLLSRRSTTPPGIAHLLSDRWERHLAVEATHPRRTEPHLSARPQGA